MKARSLAAIVAAATGAGVFAALASLPPGAGAGRPLELAQQVAVSGWFRGVASATTLALVAAALLARSWRSDEQRSGLWAVMEPLLWGVAAPLLSLLLDPWFFHSTVFVIALAGLMLGLLTSFDRWGSLSRRYRLSDGQSVAVLVVLAVLVPTFFVLPGPPWFHPVSGDEPHYLVIARSLWADGDVNVANEYSQGLTQPFWSGELPAHAKPGADPEARYSIHGPGLAAWLAPWYGVGQGLTDTGFNVLIRVAMSLWLAAAAVALFFLLRDIAGSDAALPGTALAVLTLPLLFAGPHLFPAVPAFALSCGAYTLLRRHPSAAQALAAGLLLAYLPWLHFKFLGLMAAIAAVGAWRIWKERDRVARYASIIALGAPLVLSGAAHMVFTWALYRRLSPLALEIGADPTLRAAAAGEDWRAYLTDPIGALSAAIGYFFDQREGLLFYAPHYLLAIAGFAWMMRRKRSDAVALAIVFAALVGPYALSQEIGHWGPPARPLTGALWAVALPMGIGLMLPAGDGKGGRARAALRTILVTWGICATVLLLLQADLLYHGYNVNRALVLLRYGAPGLPLADMAPLWLGPEAVRWGVSLLGLALTGALGVFLWRWGSDVSHAGTNLVGTSSANAGPSGRKAGAAFVVVAAILMLTHHASVPLTDLHEPWTHGTIRFWKAHSPPTRAWNTDVGVWSGGHDTVQMLVSSRAPIDVLVLEISGLEPMRADLQVGRDRQTFHLVPGQRSFARLRPGPGRVWNGEYFYHLRVAAHGGISRAALGIGEDTRGLGVLLQVVQANSDTP